jgi:hypothetical protein
MRPLLRSLLPALLLAACDTDDDPPPLVVPGGPVVMVVDTGFDPSLPVFAGKIAGAYTLVCRADGDGDGGAPPAGDAANADGGAGDGGGAAGDAGGPEGFAAAKAAFLATLGATDDRCELRPGIAPSPNPFPDLEAKRREWNEAVRKDDLILNTLTHQSSQGSLGTTLAKRLDAASYHGTATAGIIATENRDTRLVLVERRLATSEQATAGVSCLEQPALDLAAALFEDADVRAAYAARPSSEGAALAGLMRTHGVNVVNESYGPMSRFALETALQGKKCPKVSLRRFYAAYAALERAREAAQPRPPALLVRAAGNDGVVASGPEDDRACRIDDPATLTVGSYGFDRVRSKFSNTGACVDLYAPGEFVAAPLPGNWLFPLSGTSFAAPMVVQRLTATAARPFDPAAARAALLRLRAPNRDLPVNLFPPALNYDPRPGLQRRALTAAGEAPDVPPGAPIRLPAVVRSALRAVGR